MVLNLCKLDRYWVGLARFNLVWKLVWVRKGAWFVLCFVLEMLELNQFSLEDDDYGNIFITQEPSEESKEHIGVMDYSDRNEESGIFDVGNPEGYSDISEDEHVESNKDAASDSK